jgi:hypothetical protein
MQSKLNLPCDSALKPQSKASASTAGAVCVAGHLSRMLPMGMKIKWKVPESLAKLVLVYSKNASFSPFGSGCIVGSGGGLGMG